MLTGISTVDTAQYEQLIDFAIESGGNLTVFGQAGIGKTEIPFQRSILQGKKAVYWNLSTQEAPDLVGLPIIKEENGVEVVRYAAPEYMPIKDRTPEPVVVIVDEIDKCKPEMQNPLLEILQGGGKGTHSINGRLLNIQAIIMTANLPDENAFSKPVSHALMNRSQVFRLETNYSHWVDWAANAGINPLVTGFIFRNSDYFSRAPVSGDPTAYVRCSPRAWTNAGNDIDKCSRDDIDWKTLLVAGRVGMEPASKFRIYLEHYRYLEPMIDALADRGEVPNLNNLTIDRLLVLGISACGRVASKAKEPVKSKGDEEKLKKAVHTMAKNVFKCVAQLPPDYQVAALKSSFPNDLVKKFDLVTIPDVMKSYMNVRKSQTGE